MSASREKKTEKKTESGSAENGNPPLLFVDAVENGRARLLFGRDAFEVPAVLLPHGAREGTWLRWSLALAPAPDDDQGAALRAKLGRGDDGGDIDL